MGLSAFHKHISIIMGKKYGHRMMMRAWFKKNTHKYILSAVAVSVSDLNGQKRMAPKRLYYCINPSMHLLLLSNTLKKSSFQRRADIVRQPHILPFTPMSNLEPPSPPPAASLGWTKTHLKHWLLNISFFFSPSHINRFIFGSSDLGAIKLACPAYDNTG